MTDPLDALLGDDEDAPEQQPDSKGNAAFAEMRKTNKQLQKELEELRAFKVEQDRVAREQSITSVFSEVGLNPKHAKLYSALNPEGEATPETVAQFASEYGLVTNAGDEVEAPAPQPKGFTPTIVSEASIPGSKVLSHDEFVELMKTDPNKAFQLHQAGRVRLDSLSDIGGESVRRV